MTHEKQQGLQELEVSQPSSRARVARMPPGVWPQVSQADMGRVVRRLRGTAERMREEEREKSPRMRLVIGG
jgi:hypothetical protein